MCQLCAIKTLNTSARWPKPLEPSVKDLNFLIDIIHEEFQEHETTRKNQSPTRSPQTNVKSTTTATPTSTTTTSTTTKGITINSLPATLLENTRLLHATLSHLDESRREWWISPAKRAQRKQFEDSDGAKLTALHKVNNATVERIEAMEAKLGGFVVWGLGLRGGVWELENGGKVRVGGSEAGDGREGEEMYD